MTITSCFFTLGSWALCCCCSVAKSCPILCSPMDCITAGSPVLHYLLGFPVAQMVKNLSAMQETQVRKIPWRRKWQYTPVFLPGKSHGQRSLVGHSQWGHKELDMTEQLTLMESAQTHVQLSQWCHPNISSSTTHFSSCPQPFPASRSFPESQLFASSGQSIGASASSSVSCQLNQIRISISSTLISVYFLLKPVSTNTSTHTTH